MKRRLARLTWLTILTSSLILLSSLSTTFAQSAPTTERDVVPVVEATTRAGEVLPPGMWLSVEGLAILVTEVKARRRAKGVLEGVLSLYQVARPPAVEDVTPFGWNDLLVAGGVGAGVAAVTLGVLVLAL